MDPRILRSTKLWDERNNSFWMYGIYPDPKTGVPISRKVQVPKWYFEQNVYPYLDAVIAQKRRAS